MSTNIFWRLIAILGASILIFFTAMPQRHSTNQQVSTLRKQIQEAEAQHLPKTVAELAHRLHMLGMKQKHLGIATEGIIKRNLALAKINNEHDLEIYTSLHELVNSSWLTPQERSIAIAVSIVAYQQRQSSYRTNDGDLSLVRDSIVPKGWTAAHYERRYTDLIQMMMTPPEILELDMTPYKDILSLMGERADQGVARHLPMSFLSSLLKALGAYSDYYYYALTDQELLRPLLSALQRYPKPKDKTNERLHLEVSLIRLRHLLHRHDKTYYQSLDQLLSDYEDQRDAIYYYPLLNDYWRNEHGRRYLVKKLDHMLQKLRQREESNSILAKDIQKIRRDLIQPHLEAECQQYILPSQMQASIKVQSELIERIDIECFEVPLVSTQKKAPAGSPICQQVYNIPEDPRWEGRIDTLTFRFPREGNYLLRLIATPYSKAKTQLSKHLDTIYLDTQVSRYNVVSWEDDLSDNAILHWLDGDNGRPLTQANIKSIQKDPHDQDAPSVVRHHRTDELGRIYIKRMPQYWVGKFVLESPTLGLLAFDHHISSNNRGSYRYPRVKRRGQLSLYSDRGVYRPDQEIQIYGIASSIGWHSEQASVIAHSKWQASLYGPQSRQEPIDTQELTSDELGRIYCTFSIPREALAGRYYIRVKSLNRDVPSPLRPSEELLDAESALYVDVAHYKRPQMEVSIAAPSIAYTFGDSIQLPIKVQEYSGGGIADATVSVSVERIYLWPNYHKHTPQSYQLKTDKNGEASLTLQLDAIPNDQDRNVNYSSIWTMPLNERLAHLYIITASAQANTGEIQERHLELFVGDRITKIDLDAPKSIDRDGESVISFRAQAARYKTISAPITYTLLSGDREIKQGQCLSGDKLIAREIFRGVPSGHYRLRYSSPLDSTSIYQEEREITIYSQRDRKLALPDSIPFLLLTPRAEYNTGEQPRFGYIASRQESYLYCQAWADNKQILDTLLRPEAGRIHWHTLELPSDTTELVTIRAYTMHSGQFVQEQYDLTRKQPSKDLTLRWTSFRDRILSGSSEEWRMQVLHRGKPIRGAAIASWMYDSSLDAISTPQWHRFAFPSTRISNQELFDHNIYSSSLQERKSFGRLNWWEITSDGGISQLYAMNEMATGSAQPQMLRSTKSDAALDEIGHVDGAEVVDEQPIPIQVREDMRELAYHYPTMQSNEHGETSWRFVLPDALTRWRVEVVAHTSDLDYGRLTAYVETYRNLQAKAYLPRFLREGDQSSLSTSVRNLSETRQEGILKMELFDIGSDSILISQEHPFALEPDQMTSFAFEIGVPQGHREIGVRITAHSNDFSDGEQHRLPILSNVVSEHQSLAHTLRQGKGTEIDLSALLPSTGHVPSQGQLKIRIESQPIYLALLALPRQAEPLYDNAIDISAALYAQRLARYLSQDKSLIPELKARLSRSQQAKPTNPAILYSSILAQEDEPRLIEQLIQLLEEAPRQSKEEELIKRLVKIGQDGQGLVPWFPGFNGSSSVTEVVLRQLIRSREFLPNKDEQSKELIQYIQVAWKGLENRLTEILAEEKRSLKQGSRDNSNELPSGGLEYLYLSSIDKRRSTNTVQHYGVLEPRLRRLAHRLDLPDKAKAVHIYTQLDPALSKKLIRSIQEHLSYSDEGAFFANEALQTYWWYDRSYEMVALSIEGISKMLGWENQELVAMQEWILAQKRGVRWTSTLATNEALHALMLGSNAHIPRDNGIEAQVISSVGKHIEWQSSQRSELTLQYKSNEYPKTLVLSPRDSSMVWVSAEASYPLPISEQRATGRQMTLSRQHFVKSVDHSGQERLVPIHATTKLKIGQKIVTQLYLQLERDLDFVRLSDPRVGCAEPLTTLAGYRWGYGRAAHYFEPRDAETAFYFDHLRRGQYVLEYEQVVVRPGMYQVPAAEIVCLYAPEYRAGSGVNSSLQIFSDTTE